MLVPHLCFMFNFYSFTESCACYFIHDHLLLASCFLVQLHSLFGLVSHSFFFPFSSCPSVFSHSYISTDFFCSLISARHSIYSAHSSIFPPFLACLVLAMVTRCPFSLVFSFLLILALMHAHSTSSYLIFHQLIHLQVSLLVFSSSVSTCIFETCLQCTPDWPFITHVDDLHTDFIANNNLVSPSTALYHNNHSFYNRTSPLAQPFPQIHSGFATLFPLWLSQSFRVTYVHTHTQAHTLLSQRSRAAFPLQLIHTYSIPACHLQCTCHSSHMVLSAPFCATDKFLLLALLQQSVIVII